jgi:hypothetical protein
LLKSEGSKWKIECYAITSNLAFLLSTNGHAAYKQPWLRLCFRTERGNGPFNRQKGFIGYYKHQWIGGKKKRIPIIKPGYTKEFFNIESFNKGSPSQPLLEVDPFHSANHSFLIG